MTAYQMCSIHNMHLPSAYDICFLITYHLTTEPIPHISCFCCGRTALQVSNFCVTQSKIPAEINNLLIQWLINKPSCHSQCKLPSTWSIRDPDSFHLQHKAPKKEQEESGNARSWKGLSGWV